LYSYIRVFNKINIPLNDNSVDDKVKNNGYVFDKGFNKFYNKLKSNKLIISDDDYKFQLLQANQFIKIRELCNDSLKYVISKQKIYTIT
jgi:hypothetical protein